MSASDTNTWAENNQRYLTTALAWLRLRLERLAQQAHPLAPVAEVKPEPERHGLFGGGHDREQHQPAQPAALKTDDQFKQHASDMQAAESWDEPPALLVLSKRLGLSQFERETLLLCIAMELDTRIATLCASAQDADRPFPTFALALALFDEPSWDVLSPEHPLRYWRLIEINQPAAQPLTTSPLRADERIVNYVKGLEYLDDRLATLVVSLSIDAKHTRLPQSQESLVETIIRSWQRAEASLQLIQLTGPDPLSKQLVAYYAAASLGRHLYRIPGEMFPQQVNDIETLARLWHRESMLLPLALYLDAQESDGSTPGEGHVHPLTRFLARSDGVFLLGTRETWTHTGRTSISLDVDKPTTAEQLSAWNEALAKSADDIPASLTGQFSLNLPTIYHIAHEIIEERKEEDKEGKKDKTDKKDSKDKDLEQTPSLQEQLWDACRMVTRPRLDTLAQRLELKATWDDLVLPPDETAMLHQLADQVGQRSKVYEEWGFADKMNRGMGINALFAGESGTGKTMAAEVIANALRLYLYRIDLSAVVSKYIGETEKNLRRLFDAAENGGAILFFDEADALFGKRSEVKDSHDRYANIEINYLLQRIESYRGLSILATNMKSALDTAFLRRLRFVVNFPFPGPAERKRMWEHAFPPKVPLDKLDYDRLARLNITGGSVHNIALNAAFLAAQAGTPVTMALILTAARTEFRKLERPVNEADFKLPPAQNLQSVQGRQGAKA
jgi:SpoVK/Ycf46/Vps4 family AAA+-type ATPase